MRDRRDDGPDVERILKLYDAYIRQKRAGYRQLWERKPKMRSFRDRKVVDDPVRHRRLTARVKVIRFALGFEDLTFRQRREMEQTLKNLEMAIKALDQILQKKG
jgi:hypothetical protein